MTDFFIRLVRAKPLGTVSGIFVIAFFITGVFAEFLAPYGFNQQFRQNFLESPSFEHWLGTDHIG